MDWLEYLLIALAVIAPYLFASYLVYRGFIKNGSKNSDGLVDHEKPFFKPAWEWYRAAHKETVTIKAYDNVRLSAVYIPSSDPKSTNTVILCHGFRSVNSDLAILAMTYSNLGFRILLPDARAHGLSGGAFSSFGHYEKYDLKKWINYVLRIYGATDSLLLHGVSMGAATVLLASAGEMPQNVKLIVADSPFSSVGAVFRHAAKPKILCLFLPGVSLITFLLHRFFLGAVNVFKAVRKAKTPFLIIHSAGDRVCPISDSRKMVDLSPAAYKELYVVNSDVHAEGYVADKEGIDRKLTELGRKYFAIKKK